MLRLLTPELRARFAAHLAEPLAALDPTSHPATAMDLVYSEVYYVCRDDEPIEPSALLQRVGEERVAPKAFTEGALVVCKREVTLQTKRYKSKHHVRSHHLRVRRRHHPRLPRRKRRAGCR